MTMTNAKLTEEIIRMKGQIKALVEECCPKLAIPEPEPEPPAVAPPPPIFSPPPSIITEIDTSVAYHMDFPIKKNQFVAFKFKLSNALMAEKQSYIHFTAVQMGSGGCLKMAIPEYGYSHKNCFSEISQGVATDGKYTDWVINHNTYVTLRIINEGNDTFVRLKSNGENVY